MTLYTKTGSGGRRFRDSGSAGARAGGGERRGWRRGRGLLIDLDGTLFRGGEAIPGAKEFMEAVQEAGLPHIFWTNNSTRTPVQVAVHLRSLGFAAAPERVYTSSMALAAALAGSGRSGWRVLALGEEGLREALRPAAILCADGDPQVDAVAVGLDRALTYERLRVATRHLLGGAEFFATNADRLLPEQDGPAPGAGAIVSFLETASGRRARVFGKPQPDFVRAACEFMGIRAADAWVIGDNPATDIAAGRAAGARTVLVETGVAASGGEAGGADVQVRDLRELLA